MNRQEPRKSPCVCVFSCFQFKIYFNPSKIILTRPASHRHPATLVSALILMSSSPRDTSSVVTTYDTEQKSARILDKTIRTHRVTLSHRDTITLQLYHTRMGRYTAAGTGLQDAFRRAFLFMGAHTTKTAVAAFGRCRPDISLGHIARGLHPPRCLTENHRRNSPEGVFYLKCCMADI